MKQVKNPYLGQQPSTQRQKQKLPLKANAEAGKHKPNAESIASQGRFIQEMINSIQNNINHSYINPLYAAGTKPSSR